MPSKFRPGDVLGSFELRRPLGRGAFGEVWLAIHSGELDFSKQVALKIFPHYATRSEDHYESLLNEARLVGHLKHANVVDVYRAGVDGEHAWIAMEYLAGRTLGDVLEQAHHKGLWIPRSVVVDIAVLLAEALHYAHTARDHEGEQLGIIHRDLKLANVMVSPDFGLKVLDFGIAKAVTNVSETVSDIMKGTPAYMAPEVWRLEGASPRSDLFSLGVVLFRLALARKFAEGDGLPGIRRRIVHGSAAVDAAAVARRVPELEEVVCGLLERDADERTPSARELLKQLHRIQRGMRRPAELRDFLQLLEATFPEQDVQDDALTGAWKGGPATSASAWSSLLASGDDDWLRLFGEANGEPSLGDTARHAESTPLNREAETEVRGSSLGLVSIAAEDLEPTSATQAPVEEASAGLAPAARPAWLPILGALAVGVGLTLALGRPWVAPVVDAGPAEPVALVGQEQPPAPAEVTPAAVAEVTPELAPQPVAEVTPESTPEPVAEVTPEPTPEPVVVAGPGCIEFESDPVGASVWLDGEATASRAGARNLPRLGAPGGRHHVEMGLATGARIGVDLVVKDEQRHRVVCRFGGETPGCRAMGPLGACR